MAIHNFKREIEVFLVYIDSGVTKQYKLEVTPEISFSQTFTDNATPVKTLHSQDYFERASIKVANPANFEFTIYIFKEDDLEVVHDRLLDCATFDLYISTQQAVFKLEKAVITSGTYGINRSTPLTLTISGSASKLSKVGTVGSYTVPGTVQTPTTNRTYLRNKEVYVFLDNTNISTEVYAINVELQNTIDWNKNATIQEGLTTVNAASAIFPAEFTIGKKSLSGSIGKFISSSNAGDLQDFSSSTSLRIKVGETISSTLYGFDFNMPTCSFTNRLSVDEIFTQNYDWRLTSNQSLNTTITYTNV